MDPILRPSSRIESVDALRGFAVLAILLVHNLEHFIFPVYPDDPSWLDVIDKGVFSAVFALFAGKAYAIFALLFGFTFYIQSHNQRVNGKDLYPRRELLEIHCRQYHPRTEGKPAVGRQCRTIFPDSRTFSRRTVSRAPRAFRPVAGQQPPMDTHTDSIGSGFRPALRAT